MACFNGMKWMLVVPPYQSPPWAPRHDFHLRNLLFWICSRIGFHPELAAVVRLSHLAWYRNGNEGIHHPGLCRRELSSSHPRESGDGMATLGRLWNPFVSKSPPAERDDADLDSAGAYLPIWYCIRSGLLHGACNWDLPVFPLYH